MKGARDVQARVWWILMGLIFLLLVLFIFYLLGSNASRLLVMR